MEGFVQLLATILDSSSLNDALGGIRLAADRLGFEYSAYELRLPVPFNKPRLFQWNSSAIEWRSAVESNRCISQAPAVAHASVTAAPVIWADARLPNALGLWKEARAHGLAMAWGQVCRGPSGTRSMLTLASSKSGRTAEELQAQEAKMRMLAQIAHTAIASRYIAQLGTPLRGSLTPREMEVLRWHADGKTSLEVAKILSISHDTVKFHSKNALQKIGASNTTGAAVRAAMLGILDS